MSLIRRGVERRVWNATTLTQILESEGRRSRSVAGQTVTVDSAHTVMPVWRCQHLLADIVSGLPVDQFRKRDAVRVEVEPGPFVESPSNFVDSSGWRYQMMLSALDCGNGVAYITEFDQSFRFALKAEVLAPGDWTCTRRNGALAPPVWKVGNVEVDPKRILHMPAFGPMPGSVLGMSPIEYAAQSIGMSLASRKYASDWYAKGGHPTQLLSTDEAITSDDAKTAKQRAREAMTDDDLLVLGKGWKYQPLQVNPEQAAFLGAINATAIEICGFFGIPPEMLGYAAGAGSVTYANREQRAIDLLVFTVQWWIGRMERLLGTQTAPDQFVKINVDALLRSDLLTRYNAHGIAIRSGFASPDERRALEDLAPIPNGDGSHFLWPPYRAFPDKEGDQ